MDESSTPRPDGEREDAARATATASRFASALYNLRLSYHDRVRALLAPLPPEGDEHAEARATNLLQRRAVGELLADDARQHDALMCHLARLGLLDAAQLAVGLIDVRHERAVRDGLHAPSVEPAAPTGEAGT